MARPCPPELRRNSGAAGPPQGCRMHYVSILLNEAKTKTYTGVAGDVEKRLAMHNAGRARKMVIGNNLVVDV